MCVYDTDAREPDTEPQQYYEIDDADIDKQPNSSDIREETGFTYYGTGSVVEIAGEIPDERTILARQLQALEEEDSQFPSVKYFCPPSTENVRVERQRSTGLTYFHGVDYRSVRYFCPGKCDYMPAEPERDTGSQMFIGWAYDDAEYRVNPIPEFGNLCDVRVVSGCHYYGGGKCVKKIMTVESLEALPGERYFCPGSCVEMRAEQPRDTGLLYYGPPADFVSSTDSLPPVDIGDEVDDHPSVKYFCTPSCENVTVEMPRDTGKRYFTGATPIKTTGHVEPQGDTVPSGRYFIAVATDQVPVERPRETGEREFGAPDVTLVGYDSNLSDTRTESGCVFYSGEPCIDVITADKTVKPPKLEKYFCPGVCAHIPLETPRDTGLRYFGGVASPSSSISESLADEQDTTLEYAFNLTDVRMKTGYLYYSGKMYEGFAPVRYFCPGSCESLAPEPVRGTGSDYFGSEAVARMPSLVGFDANLSDVRTETGCQYYGPGPCVEVRGWDRVPRCLSWTCHQVAGWIESLGFSYYRASVQRR